MYEISLVPDVKAELIKKLKLRNLVIFICIIVAASCVGIFMILFGVTTGQGLALAALDEEMACRSEGVIPKSSKACNESKYGTAIYNFENVEGILTIQDQMKNISLLNSNKVKFSRIFNVLDVILPSIDKGDENTIKISDVSADIQSDTLSFEGLGYSSNNIGYRSLEAFMKNVSRTYYDYGNYMRYDYSSDSYVAIPSFCITEEKSGGVIYGIYHKGKPGCEAPMVKSNKSTDDTTDETAADRIVSGGVASIDDLTTDTSIITTGEVTDIKIRRTYNDASDIEDYKNGRDRYATDSTMKTKGYYFESSCLKYDDNGKFSETMTIEACPLLSEDVTISDSSYGRDADENMVLSFSAILNLSHDVFLSGNKHMMVVGPTRQNVTDSYIQVGDMFTEAAHDTEEE